MNPPHAVVELPTFVRQAAGLLDDDERHAVIDMVARNAEAGDVIPGTGGARKLRVPLAGKGKSGGARIIYYFGALEHPIYLFAIYAKSAQINLTSAQSSALSEVVAAIKAAQRRNR